MTFALSIHISVTDISNAKGLFTRSVSVSVNVQLLYSACDGTNAIAENGWTSEMGGHPYSLHSHLRHH